MKEGALAFSVVRPCSGVTALLFWRMGVRDDALSRVQLMCWRVLLSGQEQEQDKGRKWAVHGLWTEWAMVPE